MLEDRTLSNSIETVIAIVSGLLLFWRRLWRVVLWIFEALQFVFLSVQVARKVRAQMVSLKSLKGDQAMVEVTAGKYGIKDTKELISFGMALVSAAYTAKTNDGVIDGKDLPLLVPPLMELPAAIEGAAQAVPELSELDEAEAIEIRDLVLSKLPGVGDKWKSVATHALMVAQGAVGLWNDFKPVPVS
jgi:hypothetical protein